jgi:hypothetical protein
VLPVCCVLAGVLSGIYVCGLIHDHRVADLSATEYVAMHKMRDSTFRRVMPMLGLGTLFAATACAVAASTHAARALLIASGALLLIDIVLTIGRQLPLNRRVQTWRPETIPSDWREVRDRWKAQHMTRTLLGVSAYVCSILALAQR